MGFSFFSPNKPKKYNYIPRYFDPQKEALEQKKASMGLESKLSDQDILRSKLRAGWKRNQEEENKRSYKSFRWIIIVALIAVLCYTVFFTGVIDNLVSGMMNN